MLIGYGGPTKFDADHKRALCRCADAIRADKVAPRTSSVFSRSLSSMGLKNVIGAFADPFGRSAVSIVEIRLVEQSYLERILFIKFSSRANL